VGKVKDEGRGKRKVESGIAGVTGELLQIAGVRSTHLTQNMRLFRGQKRGCICSPLFKE